MARNKDDIAAVTLRMPSVLSRRLRTLARVHGVSLNTFILRAVDLQTQPTDGTAPERPGPSEAMCAKLTAAADAKGVDVDTLVRIALANLARPFYALEDRMGFGKYATETVETVIRCDPSYALWAARNVDRFRLNDDATIVLDGVLTDAKSGAREDGA